MIKVGDKVRITEDHDQLNIYMKAYSGMEAFITSVKDAHSYGQIAKLDIDDGEWSWFYEGKLDQIIKID